MIPSYRSMMNCYRVRSRVGSARAALWWAAFYTAYTILFRFTFWSIIFLTTVNVGMAVMHYIAAIFRFRSFHPQWAEDCPFCIQDGNHGRSSTSPPHGVHSR